MKTKIALWEVRNEQGQFLGTYYAVSADQAITRFLDGQAQYSSTFRGSVRNIGRGQLKATRREAA